MPISDERLKELAIKGLEAEMEELRTGGPKLTSSKRKKPSKTRRPMSAKEKKEHSERMKKIWAERRKVQK